MSEQQERGPGSCLCGAVRLHAARVSAPGASAHVGACHCRTCRVWGGGPLLAVDCGVDVRVEGADQVTVFDSSAWAERGFCARCGTHLFYRLKGTGQYIVPAGLLGDGVALDFDHQVFIDEKPDYYAFVNVTENMTGAEAFAAFAPPPE